MVHSRDGAGGSGTVLELKGAGGRFKDIDATLRVSDDNVVARAKVLAFLLIRRQTLMAQMFEEEENATRIQGVDKDEGSGRNLWA